MCRQVGGSHSDLSTEKPHRQTQWYDELRSSSTSIAAAAAASQHHHGKLLSCFSYLAPANSNRLSL